MPGLPELLRGYAQGRTDIQHEVLDEVEPLLFGMVRSLHPNRPDAQERSVRLANALTLAFHLRASAGRLPELADAKALRGYAHQLASTKLADEAPIELKDLADPETGRMIYKCYGIGLELEDLLDAKELQHFADRLAGDPAPETWTSKLQAAGYIEP